MGKMGSARPNFLLERNVSQATKPTQHTLDKVSEAMTTSLSQAYVSEPACWMAKMSKLELQNREALPRKSMRVKLLHEIRLSTLSAGQQ